MPHATLRLALGLSALLLASQGHTARRAHDTASASDGAPAKATVAHRCIGPNGTVSYHQQPCPTGESAGEVRQQDARTEAQREQAQGIAQRDKAIAQQLASKDRLDDAHAARGKAVSLGGPVRQVSVGTSAADRSTVRVDPARPHPRAFRAKTPRQPATSGSAPA
jgi:hypothetical protein